MTKKSDNNKEPRKAKKRTTDKSATAMNEIKDQLAVKAANPEKPLVDTGRGNKSMAFNHSRYVEVLGWVKDGLSSSEVIIKISDKYGYTLTSASTFFYQVLKYWRTLFKQEDVDLLRYALREKYEKIVEYAIATGELREARSSLDSVRRMFGLDKQEVEVVNKEIKFKFDAVPDLAPEEDKEPIEDTTDTLEQFECEDNSEEIE